jgi:hypothetical protein
VAGAEVRVARRGQLDRDDDRVARVRRQVRVLAADELEVVDDVLVEIRVRGVAARVDDGDGDPLAGEAVGAGYRGADRVG